MNTPYPLLWNRKESIFRCNRTKYFPMIIVTWLIWIKYGTQQLRSWVDVQLSWWKMILDAFLSVISVISMHLCSTTDLPLARLEFLLHKNFYPGRAGTCSGDRKMIIKSSLPQRPCLLSLSHEFQIYLIKRTFGHLLVMLDSILCIL